MHFQRFQVVFQGLEVVFQSFDVAIQVLRKPLHLV